VADDVPLVLIGDLARMRQLLLNLASNALKFTEEGGVEISVEIARADTIVFSVKDTGIGIGELDQKLIFDSFRQVDQGTTRQYGGVGMGLAVNRQLVEAMQGQITVESVLGEGTTFRVELPMQEGELPDTERAEENAASPAYLKALLVEDHELNRELLTEMLRLSGCEAIGTGSADEALDLLEAQQFDVVLMDLHMPGKDGADLTREWRKIESDLGRQSVRIIGISADVRLEERQRCSVAGMDDFLGKPFSLAALKEMLQAQRALGKRNP
jgi:CheY-like chemotaxis protein/anti-sigma regulatory factor (Ser/Thr protein kinase)